MSTVHDQYFGAVDEVTYGTAVAVDKFFEFVDEGIAGSYERIESAAIRAGRKVLGADRFAPNHKGAAGDVSLEVLSTGFDYWLKHMLGAVTSGTPSGGFVTHTATLGVLNGKSFTAQVGRADNTGGALIPFTYAGGKVAEWEISNSVDELLTLSLTLDFASEKIGAGAGALALSTPVFPANSSLFSFGGGTVTVAGTSFQISEFSLSGSNGLKTDRYFIAPGIKGEPLENELRTFEWSLSGEFSGTAHSNRVAAALASGALANITAIWAGPDGTEFKIEMPYARFDEGAANASGVELVEQELSGVALTSGATSPVTITYKALGA